MEVIHWRCQPRRNIPPQAVLPECSSSPWSCMDLWDCHRIGISWCLQAFKQCGRQLPSWLTGTIKQGNQAELVWLPIFDVPFVVGSIFLLKDKGVADSWFGDNQISFLHIRELLYKDRTLHLHIYTVASVTGSSVGDRTQAGTNTHTCAGTSHNDRLTFIFGNKIICVCDIRTDRAARVVEKILIDVFILFSLWKWVLPQIQLLGSTKKEATHSLKFYKR